MCQEVRNRWSQLTTPRRGTVTEDMPGSPIAFPAAGFLYTAMQIRQHEAIDRFKSLAPFRYTQSIKQSINHQQHCVLSLNS